MQSLLSLIRALLRWLRSFREIFRPRGDSGRSDAATNGRWRASLLSRAKRLLSWAISTVSWLSRMGRSPVSKTKRLVPWKISLKIDIHFQFARRDCEAPGPSEGPADEEVHTQQEAPAQGKIPTEDWIQELDRIEKEVGRERAKQAMAALPPDLLPVELDGPLRDIPIPGSFGHKLVKKGIKLLRLAFFETSRDYWPNVWRLINDGVYLVEPTKKGFTKLLQQITAEELDLVPPNGEHLRSLLMGHVRPIRNRLEHPERYSFNNSSVVDLDLRVIEMAILLMNHRERADQVRALWNELAGVANDEATRKTKRLLELDVLIDKNPNYEISDKDLEYLHQFDGLFYHVLTGQLRPGEQYKVDESDPYLRVAKFYIQQRDMGLQCRHLVTEGYEFW